MLKENLADALREDIMSGKLRPGDSIVEGIWAAKLKVAQASIREALNILASEGFVQKDSGRTAQVTELSEENVVQIYQVRASLESLAGRLVAEKKPSLSDLDQVIADMRAAAQCNNLEAFYQRDLRFHLLVCEKSGNPFLEQAVRKLVGPLFAFVVMRLHSQRQDPLYWETSVEEHLQMVEALRTGDPVFAERIFAQTIQKFFSETHSLLHKEKMALLSNGA